MKEIQLKYNGRMSSVVYPNVSYFFINFFSGLLVDEWMNSFPFHSFPFKQNHFCSPFWFHSIVCWLFFLYVFPHPSPSQSAFKSILADDKLAWPFQFNSFFLSRSMLFDRHSHFFARIIIINEWVRDTTFFYIHNIFWWIRIIDFGGC